MIIKVNQPSLELFKEITKIADTAISYDKEAKKTFYLLGTILNRDMIYWIEKCNLYVWKEDNVIKGFVVIRNGKKGLELISIAVKKCYRGQGIGNKLLEHVRNTYNSNILLQCMKSTPSEEFWDKEVSKGHCYKHTETRFTKKGTEMAYYTLLVNQQGLLNWDI